MSSKSTIFLTKDNEHCYTDCCDYLPDGRDPLFLEIDKKHAEIILNDENDLVIRFTNPDSQIYKLLEMLKNKEDEL